MRLLHIFNLPAFCIALNLACSLGPMHSAPPLPPRSFALWRMPHSPLEFSQEQWASHNGANWIWIAWLVGLVNILSALTHLERDGQRGPERDGANVCKSGRPHFRFSIMLIVRELNAKTMPCPRVLFSSVLPLCVVR